MEINFFTLSTLYHLIDSFSTLIKVKFILEVYFILEKIMYLVIFPIGLFLVMSVIVSNKLAERQWFHRVRYTLIYFTSKVFFLI